MGLDLKFFLLKKYLEIFTKWDQFRGERILGFPLFDRSIVIKKKTIVGTPKLYKFSFESVNQQSGGSDLQLSLLVNFNASLVHLTGTIMSSCVI